MQEIIKLFEKPKIIGLIANVNQGKSNLLYWLVEELRKEKRFNLVTFGLRVELEDCLQIFSTQELEQIKNSVILIDEFVSLFDLDNRKIRKQIENTLRLIHHNNNVLVLCGLPENFKKFIAGRLNAVLFKKITFDDLINGSAVKKMVMAYSGVERGSEILQLEVNECLIYDRKHYTKINVPLLEKYDTKEKNPPILNEKESIMERLEK